jgi:Abnormal spindle-like microcephaly-assoc'd, ASPM-SPD-2-Hydin/Protein of unknown function (DUF1573)
MITESPRRLRIGPLRRLALVLSAALLGVAGWGCGGSSGTTATPTTPTTPVTPTGPAVGLSPATLTFASVTSDPQSVTLTNTGTEVVVITSVVATGNFTETDNCVGSVSVGATCTITVAFTPLAPGASGLVTITDNAAGNPHTVSLAGPNLTPPAAVLSPTSLTFASRAIGTTSAAQTVTLTNPVNGLSAPLTITSISAVGDFAIAQNGCGRVLAAGASCAIGVTFTPTGSGARTGVLALFDNAPSLQQGVPLNGTGQ